MSGIKELRGETLYYLGTLELHVVGNQIASVYNYTIHLLLLYMQHLITLNVLKTLHKWFLQLLPRFVGIYTILNLKSLINSQKTWRHSIC